MNDNYFPAKPNIFTNTAAGCAPLPCAGPRPLPWVTLAADSLSTEALSCRPQQPTTPGRCRPAEATLTVVRGWMSYLENLACQVLPAFLYPSKQNETTNKILECKKVLSNSGNYAKILLYAETKLLKFYNYEQFSFSLPKNIQKLPDFMHVRENDMCCAKFIFYICFCCTNRIKMLTIFYAQIAFNCF